MENQQQCDFLCVGVFIGQRGNEQGGEISRGKIEYWMRRMLCLRGAENDENSNQNWES